MLTTRSHRWGLFLATTLTCSLPAIGATTFEEWRLENFTGAAQTDSAISGLLATPRNDGFSNLLKYSLGLSVDETPNDGITRIIGTNPLTVTFNRPIGLTDLTYLVQFSSTIGQNNDWQTATLSTAAIAGNPDFEQVTASDPQANSQTTSYTRLFVRHSSGAIVGIPQNLNVTENSPTEATLTFDPVDGAAGYLVESVSPQGTFEVVGYVNAGSSSYDISGIIPQREATYRVRAISGDNSVTEASAQASITTDFGDQGSLIVRHAIVDDGNLDAQRNVFVLIFENKSSAAVPLNEFSIRRWMIKESDEIRTNYYFVGGAPDVSNGDTTVALSIKDLATESPTADSYIEFDFSALDNIIPPDGTFRLSGQIFYNDTGPRFTASNDYSTVLQANSGAETPVNPLVGLYRDSDGDGTFADSEIIFGLPPGGGNPNGPKAPIALRARPLSESSIELVWEDADNNESLYVIERDFMEDEEGFSILTTTAANSLQFSDEQLLDEAEYTYRVRAVNQNGASSLTNTATTATLPGTSPQFIPAAPATLEVSPFSSGRLDLVWSDSSRNERGFVIERSQDGGPFQEIAEVTRGITSYIDFGLDPATSYQYRIRAFNLAGERASAATGGSTEPTPAPTPFADVTDAEIARFLRQATFGAAPTLIADVRAAGGYAQWLDAQFALSPTLHEADTAAAVAASGADLTMAEGAITGQAARQNVWWDHILTAPDQARQRLAFALSQIMVASQNDPDLTPQPVALAKFYDLFVSAPESNFRELLEDVTFSPVMGMYLDHTRNQKANTIIGVRPDENYAREIMQLFSIGLHQLNLDGTPKLDDDGNPLPTYNQRDIEQMARIFTGLTYAGGTSTTFFTGAEDYFNPMVMVADFHETDTKDFQLLNSDIPDIAAGGDPLADLEAIHNGLANHASTAPFICRQLIQRTVTSNPSPAYVERVSAVFEDNGSGVRGDLAAVFKAILLDYEARSADPLDSLTYGKQREPIIRLATLLRALDATPSAGGVTIGDLSLLIQQAPMKAPSVFNFFEPGFSLPGAINDQGLDSPEFQTSQSSTVLQTINVAGNFIFDPNFSGLELDFSRYEDSSLDVDGLLDLLERDLLDGRLPTDMRLIVGQHLTGVSDIADRARIALYLIVSSPQFNIEQ